MPVNSAARLILAVVLIAVLSISAVLAFSIAKIRRDVWRDAEIQVTRTTRLLEEHALKVLGSAEATLGRVADFVVERGWGSEGYAEEVAQRARSLVKFAEQESIWIADEKGRVRAQTLSDDSLTYDVSEREWFAVPAQRRDPGIHVGARVRGLKTGIGFIPVSLRMEDRDGRFLGVAQLSLRPDYFVEFYEGLKGPSGAVTLLFRADGNLLTRAPPLTQDPPDGALMPIADLVARAPESGGVQARLPLDGVERLFAYRRVGDHPLYVAFGLSTAGLNAEWLGRSLRDAASTLPALLVLIAVGWFAYRKAAEVDMAHRTLEARVQERTAALAESERRTRLLAAEVDHRAKNLMAVIQSLMRMTKAKRIEDYVSALQDRISSLARTHSLLSDSEWEGADLMRLLSEELAPYAGLDSPRVRLHGPAVVMDLQGAQLMGMVFHELATNAAKYGALSSPEGRVEIGWHVADGRLYLEWKEIGGPPVRKPPAQGFGTRLITRSLDDQLRGEVRFDWRQEGLCVAMSAPLDRLVMARKPASQEQAQPQSSRG